MRFRFFLLLLITFGSLSCEQPSSQVHHSAAVDSANSFGADVAALREAFERRLSGIFVETEGVVERVLADDLKGSRHQRFILRLSNGQTVLVAHNIDIAPRVPDLAPGARLRLAGDYEWNDKGGVIHWTHHDPQARRIGGWIETNGRRYE